MENSDVTKIRSVLRSVTYQKTVVNRETGEKNTVSDILPIVIEFDNSLSMSEKSDIVMWDDTNAVVYGVTYNGNCLRGAEHIGGADADKMNAGALYAVDYGEIQQMRAELNQETFLKFMDKFKTLGCKVNYNGKEVVLSDAAIENAKKYIFGRSNPEYSIRKTSKFNYIDND